MSKAFTREDSPADDEDLDLEPQAPAAPRNYVTPAGHARMRSELKALVETERPEVVRTVAWAAGNGDRSENGDYIYGKRRLREIDRRIRYLMKRLDIAEVVDAPPAAPDRVYFGATVKYARCETGEEHTVSIVGTDEVDPARGRVSWVSPIAKALIKAAEGDVVTVQTPSGPEEVEILEVRYDPLP